IPRTFIDTNRVEDAAAGGGLTASVPGYICDDADRQRLLDWHRRYVALVEEAFAALEPGGLGLLPHTYGPRTLGILTVGADTAVPLGKAHERVEDWPLRPEIDLIVRDPDGALQAPAALVAAATARFQEAGFEVADSKTYPMHPATLAHRWTRRRPGRVFCLEVRRDLLVRDWVWTRENQVDAGKADKIAAPLSEAIRVSAPPR